jgi:hypothetical protein
VSTPRISAVLPGATGELADTDAAVRIAALDAALVVAAQVRAVMKAGGGEIGVSLPWQEYIRYMRLLNPQSYGSRLQKWLAKFYDWKEVPSSEDRGDVKDSQGDYYEVKVSLLSSPNPVANFVQIRPWQNVTGYRCFVVLEDNTVVQFYLEKAQMDYELAQCGGAAHGVADVAAASHKAGTKEWAIRFPFTPGNAVYDRWMSGYWLDAPHPC